MPIFRYRLSPEIFGYTFLWFRLRTGQRFPSGARIGFFVYATASRLALGPTQPPSQSVRGALSLEVKRPGREADHSSPSSAEVKNTWSYTSTHQVRLRGMVLS
jgi:hypothetical protein